MEVSGEVNGTVYILGTEMHPLQELLEIIRRHGIVCVIDVRNYTETLAQKVQRIELKEFFYSNQIHYRDYSESLSMDTQERKYLNSNGYMDFTKYRSSLGYSTAISKLKEGVRRGYNCCVIGYRRGLGDCHRSILVGHGLLMEGVDAMHITSNIGVLPQSELEKMLVEQAFPTIEQMTLFDMPQQPFEDKLETVLKDKNKELGKRWLAERSYFNAREEQKPKPPRWFW